MIESTLKIIIFILNFSLMFAIFYIGRNVPQKHKSGRKILLISQIISIGEVAFAASKLIKEQLLLSQEAEGMAILSLGMFGILWINSKIKCKKMFKFAMSVYVCFILSFSAMLITRSFEIENFRQDFPMLNYYRPLSLVEVEKIAESKTTDGRDILKVVHEFAKLAESDSLAVENKSNPSPLGDAHRMKEAINGKITADDVICGDAVAYCFHRLGEKCGRLALYTSRGWEESGHIEYLCRFKSAEGNRWLLLSWNCFKFQISEPNENVLTFIQKATIWRTGGKYFFVTY